MYLLSHGAMNLLTRISQTFSQVFGQSQSRWKVTKVTRVACLSALKRLSFPLPVSLGENYDKIDATANKSRFLRYL